jgi:hypothetical protein
MVELKAKSWLLFVEDPGALNYFMPLIKELQSCSLPFLLYTEGHAIEVINKNFIEPLVDTRADLSNLSDLVDFVIVGTSENPESFAFELIDKAKRDGITSVAIVDSGINAAYRFQGRTNESLFHAPDYLLVPDYWTVEEYVKYGFIREKIFVVDHPMNDIKPLEESLSLIRKNILPAEALNRFVLVFISEISTGLYPEQYRKSEQYTFQGRGSSVLRTEIVAEELLDAISNLASFGIVRPYMILRRHPKETNKDLKYIAKEFDLISTTEDPIQLVSIADLVVGMTSNLLNEAYLNGVEVVSILPRVEELNWISNIRNGNIKYVSERNGLILYLQKKITNNETKEKKSRKLSLQSANSKELLLNALIKISKYN